MGLMPYIPGEDREKFDQVINVMPSCLTKGEFEYVIMKLAVKYMVDREFKYSNLHDCVYAIQHVADEFRRRYLDKREDFAMDENGDVV